MNSFIPGAFLQKHGQCRFSVWAPRAGTVVLRVLSDVQGDFPMTPADGGCFELTLPEIFHGTRYQYLLNGNTLRPDPASHYQPQGPHGPSEVVDHSRFNWDDRSWPGIPLENWILYEIHPGTFTPEGTFEAIVPRLRELRELGINVLEIMPVSQFPGKRNWGYDGTYPYAVQNSYGGPEGLKTLVDAAHSEGLAVVLDVVYNHLGPEGNYLAEFGPYFTGRYHTPWGMALNFDDADCDWVRNFFIENALYWFREYHLDGLRLDAIHSIFDQSARPFLQELKEAVAIFSRSQGRELYLIAESDLNDTRVLQDRAFGGFGMDSQWSDEFHHAVHALVTGEESGYYSDFGLREHLLRAFRDGFVYTGQYSRYRRRRYGNDSSPLDSGRFVTFIQNHDQIGNRMFGERLSSLVSFETLKLCAGVLLLSPYVPLLFMGEEYGEKSPFLYFVSHTDPDLQKAVREGRRREFQAFGWAGEPPDPSSEETFNRCVLEWGRWQTDPEKMALRELYRELIRLRGTRPALTQPHRKDTTFLLPGQEHLFGFIRSANNRSIMALFNFGKVPGSFGLTEGGPRWRQTLCSADPRFQGQGDALSQEAGPGGSLTLSGESFAVYESPA